MGEWYQEGSRAAQYLTANCYVIRKLYPYIMLKRIQKHHSLCRAKSVTLT